MKLAKQALAGLGEGRDGIGVKHNRLFQAQGGQNIVPQLFTNAGAGAQTNRIAPWVG